MVPYVPRSQAGANYCFIDFRMSSYFPADAPSKLVTGKLGRDREVPELSDGVPYDPFLVDIFSIGNVFRTEFYDASVQTSLSRKSTDRSQRNIQTWASSSTCGTT